jgi:dihydroxy-acid dehydratase
MPEAGYLPIPGKLARAGVKDMIRISDARMSGTAFGTIILHVTPESAVGGPLSLVKNGDAIRLSVRNKQLDLLVDDAELSRRRALVRPSSLPTRGWAGLYARSVQQAGLGCDFEFLTESGFAETPCGTTNLRSEVPR